jgi:prepilin-type N-terminal cleavage/methylation domain-containing protein
MNYQNQKNNKGFTLVETLVAIGVLTLSIAGTFTAVQNGVKSSNISKDETTAFYLAQEGMESIKNIRDQNALLTIDAATTGEAGTDWLYGLAETASDPCAFGRTCIIDAPYARATRCDAGFGSCPYLLYDSSESLYNHTTGSATTFKRELQFTEISAGREIKVTMNISWIDRGTTRSFQVSEFFLNRQQ